MKISSPKKTTWLVAAVLGALGLIGALVTIPVLTGLSVWLALIGLALLLVACYTNNL